MPYRSFAILYATIAMLESLLAYQADYIFISVMWTAIACYAAWNCGRNVALAMNE